MMITIRQLRQAGACQVDLRLAELVFGKQARLTRATLLKAAAAGIDLDWIGYATDREDNPLCKLNLDHYVGNFGGDGWQQVLASEKRQRRTDKRRSNLAYSQRRANALADVWGLA